MAERDLSGKVVVITGASSGFGRGAAMRFAGHGASVVIAARRGKLLDEVVRECESLGGSAIAVPTDVSNRAEMEHLCDAALRNFGHFDVWVNNAGVGALGLFDEVPIQNHEQVIGTDLLGTIYGSYLAMREFRKRGRGTLINVSSALGKIPAPYYASYSAAKYGVVGLSAALRQELAENEEYGVHVCTVMPMAHDTPFFDHAANYTGHTVKPIPPLYDPKKVIDTIVQLADEPHDEIIVGATGKLYNFAHNLMPVVVEKMMSKEAHRVQMRTSPAPASDGGVRKPMLIGTGIYGGRRKR